MEKNKENNSKYSSLLSNKSLIKNTINNNSTI